jgi:hypothetical protein
MAVISYPNEGKTLSHVRRARCTDHDAFSICEDATEL